MDIQIIFINFFWKDICYFYLRSVNHSYELIYNSEDGYNIYYSKGEKPRESIKNWRPISLLNTSFKIVSACLAGRLKLVLNSLIHEIRKAI